MRTCMICALAESRPTAAQYVRVYIINSNTVGRLALGYIHAASRSTVADIVWRHSHRQTSNYSRYTTSIINTYQSATASEAREPRCSPRIHGLRDRESCESSRPLRHVPAQLIMPAIRPRRIVGAGRDLDLAAELTVLRHAAFTPARANNSNIIICSALADHRRVDYRESGAQLAPAALGASQHIAARRAQ